MASTKPSTLASEPVAHFQSIDSESLNSPLTDRQHSSDLEHHHEHLDDPQDLPVLIPPGSHHGQNPYPRRNTLSTSPRNHSASAFFPLSQTSSRFSNRSTFVDPQNAISALSEISRAETRVSRVGEGYTTGRRVSVSANRDGDDPEDDGKIVAVQITPDGEELVFPDGGKEAWLCIVGAFAALFVGFGLAPAAGAFQTYYHATFLKDYSSSQVSWIGSTQQFVSFGLAPFSGSLFDKLGHRPLIVSGTFSLVLGYCMLSLSSKYYQIFLCHATLIPIGMNFMFITPVGVVSQWFAVRRGMAFGIIMAGAATGATLWPLVWSTLPQRIGFGWTMRFIALVVAIFGAISFLLLKTRLPPKPPGPFFHLKMFKSFPYSCLGVTSFTWAFAFNSWIFFVGTYGNLANLRLAPYFLVIMNAASVAGRLGVSLVADRMGVYNLTIISLIIMTICFWAWLACTTTGAMIGINIIFGITSGTYISLQAPMITRLVDDMRFGGTTVGQILLFSASGQLLGPPVFGAVLGHGSTQEQLGRFKNCLYLGSSVITLSTVVLIVARRSIEPKWLTAL